MTSRSNPRVNLLLVYALLLIGCFIFLTPMIWMLGTSLKPLEQTTQKDFSFLPSIAYADVDGHRTKVRIDDQPIEENGSIMVVDSGPRKGDTVYVTARDFDGRMARLEVQIADRVATETYPAHAIKDVKKGWYRVVEKIDQYKEGALAWTIVPDSEIERKVEFQWSNYSQATKLIPFKKYTINTLIIAILGMIGTTLSSSLVAYGFSRIEWRGRDTIFVLLLATMMIPFPVTMIPLYGVYKQLGMIGTLQPLWVPCFFGSAFNIFLLRQFFMTIPTDISEAARIDGCNEFQIFAGIILPLAKPALMVVALFHFMWAWNDFMSPLIYLTNDDLFTLSIGLQSFQSKAGGIEWHFLMAACTLTILPIIALFFAAQKTFVQGISMSGMKE